MANEEHLAILRQGVEVWNRWRLENKLIRPNLHAATLHNMDLRGVDLSGVDLTRVDLTRTNLSEADLSEAVLTEVDFHQATVGWTAFVDVDLHLATGLGTVKHLGPSPIDVFTFSRSQGRIPEAFLRGAGVPENFIRYIGSLVAVPIQFYSCFISYSTTDEAFADRLHADLQSKGVRCWFAPHDVKGGRKLHQQIDEAIRLYDRLLLILSPASMTSEWVAAEIAKARKREQREKRQMLLPVRVVGYDVIREWEAFDADTGKDSAREIREYFIPDFSRWKDDDAYQVAFDRLLRDLKAEAADCA